MDWLTPLWTPRFDSRAALARAMFASAGPALGFKNAHSLNAALGRMQARSPDALRPAIRSALRDALGFDDDLALYAHVEHPEAGVTPVRVELHDLREARPLDLTAEALFPGVPDPDRLFDADPRWWHAASGAGRRLLGRWLTANARATVIEADSLAEALARLPDDGPVYIVLSGRRPSAPVPPAALGPYADGDLCVAAPQAPPDPRRDVDDPSERGRERAGSMVRWSAVAADGPDVWRGPLLDWIAERIPPGGGFDRLDAQRLFTERPALAAACDTPGQVMMVCGLLERFRFDRLLRADPATLLDAWIEHVADRAGLDADRTRWLRDEGPALFDGLVRGRLLDPDEAAILPAARWAEWLGERRAPPDHVALHALAVAARRGRRGALDQLEAATRPGPLATLDFLVDVRLLSREAGGLRIRAGWIARQLERRVVDGLLDGPVETLGAFAWAHPDPAIESLMQHFEAEGFGLARRVLDALDPEAPMGVAAFEAVLRAVGLRVLLGQALDDGLRRDLWAAQMAQIGWLAPETPPHLIGPRLLHDGRGRVALGGRWAWRVALMALAEGLDAPPVGHVVLDPWRWPADADAPAMRAWLHEARPERLVSFFEARPRPDLAEAAVRMLGRWWRRIGPGPAMRGWAALKHVAVVERVAAGEDPPVGFDRLDLGCDLPLIAAWASARGVEVRPIWRALWRAAWDRQQHGWWPRGEHAFGPQGSGVWLSLEPADLDAARWASLARAARAPGGLPPGLPWGALSAAHYAGLGAALAALDHGSHFEVEGFLHILDRVPDPVLARFVAEGIGEGVGHREIAARLWDRLPREMGRRLDEAVARRPLEVAFGALYQAPDGPRARALDGLLARIAATPADDLPTEAVKAWLRNRISDRGRHWRRAYAQLHRLTRPLVAPRSAAR